MIPHIGGVHVDEWMKNLRGAVIVPSPVCLEWELLDRNPAGARFRAAKRKRTVEPSGTKDRFLNPEQPRAFLAAVSGDRHEALYALALTTGLRPSHGKRTISSSRLR